jgi:hypothetical protein
MVTKAVGRKDLIPAVDRSAIPPMFQNLVDEIQSMQSEVSAVEGEYSVDCSTICQYVRLTHTTLSMCMIPNLPIILS